MPDVLGNNLMGREEAQQCITAIRHALRGTVENLLEVIEQADDLKRREGWRQLGYASWGECVSAEFSVGWRQMYRIFQAGRLAQELCGAGADMQVVIVKHMMELAKLPTNEMRLEVYSEAARDGEITTPRLRQLVEQAQARVETRQGHDPRENAPKGGSGGVSGPRDNDRLKQIESKCRLLKRIHAGLTDVADQADVALDAYLEVVRSSQE